MMATNKIENPHKKMVHMIPIGSISHKIKEEQGALTEAYINTDLLIIEVEVRPILYTPPLCNDLRATDVQEAWADVADHLNVSKSECIRIWMDLVKTFQHFHTTNNTKLRWTFYEQMQFIAPYIHVDSTNDSSICDIIIDESAAAAAVGGSAVDIHDEDSTSHHELVYAYDGIDDQNELVKYDCVMDDEDLFLLSFAPSLARMTRKQNGQARLRILEYLYKLEFEED